MTDSLPTDRRADVIGAPDRVDKRKRRSGTSSVWLWLLRLVVIMCGGIDAWLGRFSMNPDGVSYLDISDHFLRSWLSDPGNAYWSPLYPFVLAISRSIFGTQGSIEFQVAHGANFLIFGITLAAGEGLARTLAFSPLPDSPAAEQYSTNALLVLVYLVTAWAALQLITLSAVTPDLLVMTFVTAASIPAVNVMRGTADAPSYAALGILLGLGYLAKTIVFPVSLVLFGILILARHDYPHLRRMLLAIVLFCGVCAPHIIALSSIKGSFTFGDVGIYVRGWFLGGLPKPLWGDFAAPIYISPTRGVARDTLTVLFQHAQFYHVGEPSNTGTFPLWYDVTKWYRDLQYHVTAARQFKAILRNTLSMSEYFEAWLLILATVFITNYPSRPTGRRRIPITQLGLGAILVIPGLSAFALYASMYVEPRYIAPFVLVIILGFALTQFQIDSPDTAARQYLRALIFAAVVVNCPVAYGVVDALRHPQPTSDREIATFIELSLGPGALVAVIGDPYRAYWARISRARIVAALPATQSETFWRSSTIERQSELDSARAFGARIVIAKRPDNGEDLTGWTPIPKVENWIVRRLSVP